MKKKDILISLAIITASGLVLLHYSQRKGYVGINAGNADAVLELKSRLFGLTTITSDSKSTEIGARIYRPHYLGLSMKKDGYTWRIESQGPWGDCSKIKVRNGEATALRLGPPFLIKPQISRNSTLLSIDYAIVGQAGERYQHLITKNYRAVKGAKIKIIDEAGNIIESGSFKYG